MISGWENFFRMKRANLLKAFNQHSMHSMPVSRILKHFPGVFLPDPAWKIVTLENRVLYNLSSNLSAQLKIARSIYKSSNFGPNCAAMFSL